MLKSGFSTKNTEGGFSTFYYKVIAYGVAPIVISLIASILWTMLYVCKKKKHRRRFKLSLTIKQTALIVIYLLYPTLTNLSFSLFNCVTLEDDQIYLKRDFEVRCWTQEHIKMAALIGIPMMLFWVIGFPGYILHKLYSNR
jgi:hypothetical protein